MVACLHLDDEETDTVTEQEVMDEVVDEADRMDELFTYTRML